MDVGKFLARQKETRLSDGLQNPAILLSAWRRVRANRGGAGVDGVTIREFEKNLQRNLESLAKEIKHGAYRPQPVQRVYVPKPRGGMRPLAILTIRDRIVQRALHDLIAPIFEPEFLDVSFGFREGRSTRDAAARVRALHQRGLEWVVDGDIKDCFENIDHRLLLKFVGEKVSDASVVRLIEQFLRAHIFNEMNGRDPSVGTYQGAILSPLLCNVYLHRFDVALMRARCHLVRYADDWLIVCKSKGEAEHALRLATHELEKLSLAINPYKTRLVTFAQGFMFLGTFFVRDEVYEIK